MSSSLESSDRYIRAPLGKGKRGKQAPHFVSNKQRTLRLRLRARCDTSARQTDQMTDETENLILEHLKRFQGGQDRIERDLREIKGRLVRLEIGGAASGPTSLISPAIRPAST